MKVELFLLNSMEFLLPFFLFPARDKRTACHLHKDCIVHKLVFVSNISSYLEGQFTIDCLFIPESSLVAPFVGDISRLSRISSTVVGNGPLSGRFFKWDSFSNLRLIWDNRLSEKQFKDSVQLQMVVSSRLQSMIYIMMCLITWIDAHFTPVSICDRFKRVWRYCFSKRM